MNNLSIQYVIKNNEYPKTLQEELDGMRKVKFKSDNDNDKINTQK